MNVHFRWMLASAMVVGGIGSAFAADMAVKAPPLVATACAWCGFYVGANAGYVGADNGMSVASTPTPDAALFVVPGVTEGLSALSTGNLPVGRRDGFIGGGQAGYNWVSGKFLAGVEADIQGLSGSRSTGTAINTAVVVLTPITSTHTGSMSTSYLGTIRGRIGLLATPSWLLFVTGGLAYGEVKASNTLSQTGTNGYVGFGSTSISETRAGWAIGGGGEWMIAPKWSVKAEYLHYDLGTVRFTNTLTGTAASAFFAGQVVQTNSVSSSFRGDIVRAGVNYHFGGPIVAKY
jgi:outer membrane immunogenic protein